MEGTAARVISGVNGLDDYLSAYPAIPSGGSRDSRQKTVENRGVFGVQPVERREIRRKAQCLAK